MIVMSGILIATHNCIYIPPMCITKGTFYDKSPYKPYERNCQVYECRCCAGKSFRGNSEYNNHIKSKTHKEFIKNYPKYYKEVDQHAEEIKQLRIDKERLTRENKRNARTNDNLKTENEKLSLTINNLNQDKEKVTRENEKLSVITYTLNDNIEILTKDKKELLIGIKSKEEEDKNKAILLGKISNMVSSIQNM
jgi:hypothetical protein